MRVRVAGSFRNERGATLAVVAVCLIALLAMMALAIDMGMLYKTRADAQRAADAGALAGASVYIDFNGIDSATEAHRRAIAVATHNTMLGTIIDSTEVFTKYIPAQQRYRVWVKRDNVPTWFAHLIGRNSVQIMASATAEAANAGVGKCVKPFVLPDYWQDPDDDLNNNNWPDINGQQGGKGGETWTYNPPTSGPDHYRRFQDNDPNNTGIETGLGSNFRNNTLLPNANGTPVKYFQDQGRQLAIKVSNPLAAPAAGNFYPWQMPGGGPGGAAYRHNIATCNPVPVALSDTFNADTSGAGNNLNKPGNMIGPTKQGLDSLMSQDPNAHWVEDPPDANGYSSGHIEGSSFADPMDSPRVMLVPLSDPKYIANGRKEIKFNNMALMFLEPFDNQHQSVIARFIRFATGTGTGPVSGSLIKTLRLVQ
jgi:hypothetical protein